MAFDEPFKLPSASGTALNFLGSEGIIPRGLGFATAPINFVNLAAKLFGRESGNPKKAATFLLSQGNSLLSRQMKILSQAGLQDTPLYNELDTTRDALKTAGGTGDFARISAFEPRLIKALTKAQNIISPVPEDFTGNVFTSTGYPGSPDQRYARNILSERSNHPLNIIRDYLDVIERKSSPELITSGGVPIPSKGLASLKTGSRNQKLLAREITTGKQAVNEVWPYPKIDYTAIAQRYNDLRILRSNELGGQGKKLIESKEQKKLADKQAREREVDFRRQQAEDKRKEEQIGLKIPSLRQTRFPISGETVHTPLARFDSDTDRFDPFDIVPRQREIVSKELLRDRSVR